MEEAQTRIQERKNSLANTEEILEDRYRALEEKRAELDEIMQETREEENDLKEKAAEIETKIEPGLLRSFKRIRKGARKRTRNCICSNAMLVVVALIKFLLSAS